MSKEEPKAQIYTLPVVYVYEVLKETGQQIEIARDLLKDIFACAEEENYKITPKIVKLLWLNYSILDLLNETLEEPSIHTNEETGEEEYLVPEESIFNLQNFMITRFYTNFELNKLSCPVFLH